MGYIECLEKAGAEVIMHQRFGDYQGTMWVKVKYDGVVGWLKIHYGSCSGCDAFHSEFTDAYKLEYYYDEEKGKYGEAPQELKDNLEHRYILFGRSYLKDILTQEEAEKAASESTDWDIEAKEALNFLITNKD